MTIYEKKSNLYNMFFFLFFFFLKKIMQKIVFIIFNLYLCKN